MNVGIISNNSKIYVNISQLVAPQSSELLPALHTVTGSNYTSSFMSKGQVKYILLINTFIMRLLYCISNRCHDEVIFHKDVAVIETLTCCLFGILKLRGINNARFVLFQQNHAQKTTGFTINNEKDQPKQHDILSKVLMKKFRRTIIYTGEMWENFTI